MRRLVVVGALVISVAWLIVTAAPTRAQSPTGNVTATVLVQAAACITIAPSTFAYAPASFSTSGGLVTTTPATTKPLVQSCSTGSQIFAARGGTTTSGATWTLASTLTCPDPNKYIHEVSSDASGFFALTTSDAAWATGVAASASKTLDTRLTMPCSGSSGLSQTVSIPIVVTAIVE